MEYLLIIGLPVLFMLLAARYFLKAVLWVASFTGLLGLVIFLASTYALLSSDSTGKTKEDVAARTIQMSGIRNGGGLAVGSFALVFLILRLRPARRVSIRNGQHQFVRTIPFKGRRNPLANSIRIEVKQGPIGTLVIHLECDAPSADVQGVLLCVEAEAAEGCPYLVQKFCDNAEPREIRFTRRLSDLTAEQDFTISLDDLRIYPYKGSVVELKVFATLSINNELLLQTPITTNQLSPVLCNPALNEPPQHPAKELPRRHATWAKLRRVEISTEARRVRMLQVSDLFTGTASKPLKDVKLQIVVRNVEQSVEVFGTALARNLRRHRAFRESVVYEIVISSISAGMPIEEGLNEVLTFDTLFSQHFPPAAIVYQERPFMPCGLGLELEVRLSHPELGVVVSKPVGSNDLKTDSELFEFTDVR